MMDLRKAREFQENICFIDYAKAFDCVDHNKLREILKKMGTAVKPSGPGLLFAGRFFITVSISVLVMGLLGGN